MALELPPTRPGLHFTAVLEITRTNVAAAQGAHNRANAELHRDVSEVVRLVVRAESLEKLQAKLAAHVALIED